MSIEVMESNGHALNGGANPDDTRDTLFFLGGAALMLFGAGLILTNPAVRRYLGNAGIGNLLETAVPDIERYMKLRSM
jgi:hypothetical protein